ncbi:DUF5667 domain-containing protein [Angustibacter sp. Root456]|uniref:DUF5667 domain-containing protein n=1 Tax=Angustibacter sp. Root456 TaxID=1736539 RepID=UPI0006F1CC2F|nr:DUF5667 domain-containing protein [Angustibacter sp. Root456]KQX66195.1 hypothetical protein ASD06_07405 [Angustibacter sp. Root456]
MALTSRRDAEVFARLLDGERPAAGSAELEALAELTRALPRPAVAPRPEFVARLRTELVSAAEQRAALLPRQASAQSVRGAASRTPAGPRTIEVRFPRRLVPTLAATLVGLAVLVVGLSSRALPGDRLYDVKLGIGQAQVRLAGSDLDRGRALLSQVDHRLDEVDALVGAGDPRAAQVDVALTQAATDLADAQRVLLSAGGGTADPEALRALADASVQALGRLKALEPLLPSGSGPELHRLLDLLATGQQMLVQQVAACGAPCADLRGDLQRLGIAVGDGGVAGSGSANGAAPGGATTGPPVPQVLPTAAPTARGGLPLPSATTTPPAPGVTAPGVTAPGVTAPGVTAPGVTASVPGVVVTVPGATVTTGSGGLPSVTLPPVEATVGSLTASVSVPAIGAPTSSASSSPTSNSCVIAVGGLCVG